MLRRLLPTLVVLLVLSACQQKSQPESIVVDPGFSQFVSAFTSGVISSHSQIRVILTQPLEAAKPQQVVPEGWLRFDPPLDGQAIWQDAQTLVFTPSSPLPSGRAFTAKLKLSEFMELPEEFATLRFSFRIIAQSLHLGVDGLQIPDANKPEMQVLKGYLRTNDQATPAELEKCLSAKWNGKEMPIRWEHSENERLHRFAVEGLERLPKEQFLDLEWNGKSIGADTDGEKRVRIPPLGEFTLQQINVQRLPQLHFEVYFSDPIDPQQELQGLVYLESGTELRLEVEDNLIRAYPSRTPQSDETVHIHQSIRNASGNQLQNSHIEAISFSLQKPAVERLDEGVIMPADGQALFPFRAINLTAVNLRIVQIFEDNVPYFLQINHMDGDDELSRVGRLVYDGHIELVSEEPIDYGSWNAFAIDLSRYVAQEPGAIYRVMIGFERHQSLYPCGETDAPEPLKKHLPVQDEGGYHYNNWRWYEGYYDWDEKDDPCSNSYFLYPGRGISANLISSSLGIIAKQNDQGQYDVVVTDLQSTRPLPGVAVEALNFQNRVLGEATTNGKGIARIQSEQSPYLIVARLGEQKGYLRVDAASALSTSLFETGGTEVRQGLKGFIYGERGVWRPGDTIHLSFMLEDLQNSLPPSHPIVLELSDPKGRLVHKKVRTDGVNGLYAFHLPTSASDPTGTWQARITAGSAHFHKSLKVETIKPNRLRVEYALPEIVRAGNTEDAKLTASWLYGAPGAELNVLVESELRAMKTRFAGYEEFVFDDRSKRFRTGQSDVIEARTNAKGETHIPLSIDEVDRAPGMLELRLSTKVFEPGGDFSQDYINRPYSPYDSYVGMKFSGGENWASAINTEEAQTLMAAAVDPDGKAIHRKARLEVYKLSWHWWWEGQHRQTDNYVNMNSSSLLLEKEVAIKDGKSPITFRLEHPTWGLLLVKLVDTESGHSASKLVFAEYPYWSEQENAAPEAAAMLSLEADKAQYEVGEKAEIRIPSGGLGRIWVTVEKGDRILEQFWVEADKGMTSFPLELTAEMRPNVYVSAMLIQPHAQDANSLPIRMYGILPIPVEDPASRLAPRLETPAEVRPESTFSCKVSEAQGRAMTYTLAVVDEGLLSLTRFSTPDPWTEFHRKEALGVRTWDLYRYVMNARTAGLTPLLATGGDEALDFKDIKEVNRFKPVVRFLGPFTLEAGATNEHRVHLPNYIGAVRAMVVAGEDGAYGRAENGIQVKQPLMLLSTLPRVLGPSETVELPVQVMAMDASVKEVQVQVKTNDMLELVGENEKRIRFEEQGEKVVRFRFKVARRLGEAQLSITAKGGGFTAKENVQLAVRAPNPLIGYSDYKVIEAGATWDVKLDSPGIPGTNSGRLSVAVLPDIGLEKQLDQLLSYPHGCVEQTTSAAFPQIFLEQYVSLTAEQIDRAQQNVRSGLNRLRNFQTTYGGFSYWPGGSYPSPWGTNYAGHFMMEAEQAGYALPPGMKAQWLRFQKEQAARWTRRDADVHRHTGNDLIQAYRLYTLALANTADLGAMNRLKSDSKLSVKAAWRLAAAYALIGRTDAARELISPDFPRASYRELGHTYGSDLRDLAMAIETLAALDEIDRAAPMMVELARELNEGWHSTQTRAYSLIAFARVLGHQSRQQGFKMSCAVGDEQEDVQSQKAVYLRKLDEADIKKGKLLVHNRSTQPLFAQLYQAGIPLENSLEDSESELELVITYTDMRDRPIDIAQLEQGTDFKAVVSLKHPGVRSNYEEMALEQLFPSGWQIINRRVNEGGVLDPQYDYQDIRDDRVYTYFDLQKGQQLTMEVLLNATFCGKFYLPATRAYAMYDESIQAVQAGRWVEVTSAAENAP